MSKNSITAATTLDETVTSVQQSEREGQLAVFKAGLLEWLLRLSGVLAFIVIWAIASQWRSLTYGLLAGPLESFDAAVSAFREGPLTTDLVSTLSRTIRSFVIAVGAGVPIGVLLGSQARLYRASEILIDFFRSTPSTALFPLFLVIFGLGDVSSIAVASFAAWLVMLLNSAYGVVQAREVRRNAAKVMGARGWRLLRYVMFPDALPQIFIGMRVAISLSLVVIVVAEMFIGARNGLGKRIIDAQVVYNLPLMYGTILTCGVVGYALNVIIVLAERRFVHWTGK